MFTGLIQSVGTITTAGSIPGGRVFRIHHGLEEVPSIGASVAVNGVCLTATAVGADWFEAECFFETLNKTGLGHLGTGSKVNLEPALRIDGRLDGHIVQGHVITVVPVRSMTRIGRGVELAVELPAGEAAAEIVSEGSVALDGVSLTVAHRDRKNFSIQLIGETLEKTTLGRKRRGDLINLETDILLRGKRAQSAAGILRQEKQSIKMDQLVLWGYV